MGRSKTIKEYLMGHDRDQPHQGQPESGMNFSEKAPQLIAHWIHHNQAHAHNYCRWADTFRQNGFADAAILLEVAAQLTQQINVTLDQAKQQLGGEDGS
jgi:hypothetical protein